MRLARRVTHDCRCWLTVLGFSAAVASMAIGLGLAQLLTSVLPADIGKMSTKPKFSALFSNSHLINKFLRVRCFLFGARDVWFVVALPVFLEGALSCSFEEIGGFLGL